jgi:hypothetical protein
VQELVEVFNVVEVGGRPPIGGKAGTKGEWTIGDLVLPVPGDIRRVFPDRPSTLCLLLTHYPRIPSNTHKRRYHPHDPLPRLAYFLSWSEVAF